MKKALIRLILCIGILIAGGTVMYYFFPGALVKTIIILQRVSAGLSHKTAQVDDHRWVYLDGGKGETIVFLHGFGDTKEGWGDFPAAFINDYRVIIPDLPGFGENSRIQSDKYGVPDQSKRLDRFIESLGIKSFHLCGVSMGGAISSYYAGEHPEKVKSLMIMDPFGAVTCLPSKSWQEYENDNNKILCWRNEEDFHRIMDWAFDRPPRMPAQFIKYAIDQGSKNYKFNRKIFFELLQGGRGIMENRLLKITAPSLIIWGKNDRIFHVSCGSIFHQGIKNSRYEILDGGHMIYLDQPDKTKILYGKFLNSLE